MSNQPLVAQHCPDVTRLLVDTGLVPSAGNRLLERREERATRYPVGQLGSNHRLLMVDDLQGSLLSARRNTQSRLRSPIRQWQHVCDHREV
eukprot:6492405-Prymnesium_polylepis.1